VCILSDFVVCFFFFSSRRRHTRCLSDWSSDVCSSDLALRTVGLDSRDWKERILRKDASFTVAQVESDGPQRSGLSPKVLFADRKFRTKTGRVNLIASAPARSQVSAEFPLYLMALATDKSQSSQWSKSQPPGPA